MKPFLRRIAEVYFRNMRENIIDCCFVFPNKRSGTFFRHYMLEIARESGLPTGMPDIATIGDLTARLVSLSEASRIDQLFTLYESYRDIVKDREMVDFDRFMFWGEMILSDFDDVDVYLVDPEKLFVNLRRYREVSTDFLTPRQKEILSRYWGAEFAPESPDHFWKHLHYDEPTELEGKFLRLWEVLAPLYSHFTQSLLKRSMGTRGMIARRAVDELRNRPTQALTHRRYVFVGFNVLTLAEIAIMEELQQRGVADFYWDAVSPAFKVKGNAGARFIRRNIQRFPSRYELDEAADEIHFPKVKLVAVPSAVGQTKMAGGQLAEWVADGTVAHPDNAINTAVVMPDESLLTPMIHSVPVEYTSLNVTMGLPMRTTSFASLMTLVVSMQLHASQTRDEWEFFHEDVRKVVSHPLLESVAPDGCRRVLELMNQRRRYMIPATLLCDSVPSMTPLFRPIADTDSPADVCDYFDSMLAWLRRLLKNQEQPDSSLSADDREPDSAGPDAATATAEDIQVYFIDAYLEALEQLRLAAGRCELTMKDSTFIQLLHKALSGTAVNFVGQPLKGLQMMGVLETRALDFDNLILMSMDERIFPRKHYKRSFIPDSLRRSYGMATLDFQESIYAYYFYRLISRASNVTIYYDSRNGVNFSAEMSRYITQLIYLHPECIVSHVQGVYHLNMPGDSAISIPRTPQIKEMLRSFLTPGGRTLSASSINTYLNCPLQFYLKVIRGLDTDSLAADYMDSSTYGTIVHEVAQLIYTHWRGDAPEVKVTAEMLDSVGKGPMLDRYITGVINKHFNRLSDTPDDLTPLSGEARVMSRLIRYILLMMFELEKAFAPFDFIDAELDIRSTMTLAPDLTVNIRQYIDRVDRVYPEGKYGDKSSGLIRIVDYKTGGDKTKFNSLDELFDKEMKERPKAMFQLFFYCRAYSETQHYRGPIQPIIYQLGSLFKGGITPVTFIKDPLIDFRPHEEEYMARLERLLREMLLSDTPFTQTPIHDHCKFCLFASLCRR